MHKMGKRKGREIMKSCCMRCMFANLVLSPGLE